MNLSISQFIKYKIHIGHSYKNTKLLSSWVLYKLQNNIWIVNVFKTIFFFKNLIYFLKYLITYRKPIWFINLEITKEFMFLLFSSLSGEFACTRYWVRGLLSNYVSISKSIKKYNSKKIVYKSSIFTKIIKNWYITRYTWPRAVLLANVNSNYIVCDEAISSGIPIVAIVDSSSKSYLVKFPLISNDDSMESFYFIFNILSKLILLLKYKKLILWFFKYKKKIKEINFKSLLNKFYNITKNKFSKRFYPLNLSNIISGNLKKIELCYKDKSTFFKKLQIKKNNIFFDLQFFKKSVLLKKCLKFLLLKKKYKQKRNKRRMNLIVSKNVKRVLLSSVFFSKRKRKKLFKMLRCRKKYSAFYWALFTRLIKSHRVFYNSFLFKKKKNHKLLNLQFMREPINYKYKGFMFFPFFPFRQKKNSFFKKRIIPFIKYNSMFENRLWVSKKFYVKCFVELYYNKWFIYLFNSNLY